MKHLIGLGLLVALVGCSDDGGGDRVDEFIGTWTYGATATNSLDCDDDRLDGTDPSTGTFMIAAGTMSDLVEADVGGDCPALRFDVSGSVATLQSGQTCMFSETDQGVTLNYSISGTAGSYTLSADGMSVTGSTSATVMITGALTTTCAVSAMVAATKS